MSDGSQRVPVLGDAARAAALQDQYAKVCDSYHKIDDFRGTLLALWPILGAAAGGVTLGLTDGPAQLAIGLLGLTTSAGIAIYEYSQSLRCVDLVQAGKNLEQALLGPTAATLGQFHMVKMSYGFGWVMERPMSGAVLRHGVASAVVYTAVLCGWLTVTLTGASQLGPTVLCAVLAVLVVVVLAVARRARRDVMWGRATTHRLRREPAKSDATRAQ